jgi:glycosyltransferase EpsH
MKLLPEAALPDLEPKISFIVPVYNVEKYLLKCIQSILRQSIEDLDVILINDGSSDHSLGICNQLASSEKRVRVFSQVNRGQAAARNQGLRLARGKYISFVDPDDWVHPEMAEKSISALEHSAADFVNFRMAFIGEDGVTKHVLIPFTLKELASEEILNNALIDNHIYTSCCNKIYRRSFLVESGVSFPEVRAFEDTYFSRVLAASASKCVFVDEILYYVLIRTGSTSRKIDATKFELAADVVDMEKLALRIDSRDAQQKNIFDAHVVKFFCYLIFAAANRADSWSIFSQCLLVTDRVDYTTKRNQKRVMAHLSMKNRLLATLSGMPRPLWLLARALRHTRFGTH